MKCRWYVRTASRKTGLGLLACASVAAVLAAAGPAAGDTRSHGRETPRRQAPGLRTAPFERAAARPGLTASNTTSSRGTQQVSINVANGGTGVQNAMCRGNRGCDIVQALGVPYAGGAPVRAPAPRAMAATPAKAKARHRAASPGGPGDGSADGARPGARAGRGTPPRTPPLVTSTVGRANASPPLSTAR
ncbi:hypothetical protein [Microbispora sp. H10836]|uniref:hypothetical protein n=1 Tax=Microbispora sp. H10836 TaxID=2729106 RepID=UPI00147520CD|nr:hypothetical protein [Microbispora sp. H10836]